MNSAAFWKITRNFTANIRGATPKATGNLAYNATRYEPTSGGDVRVYVNTQGDHKPESADGIAPYFIYVNYYEYLRGKRNRNYHYWDRAIDAEAERIAAIVGGTVTKEGEPGA